MSKLFLSVILVALAAGSLSDRRCSCQKANQDDLPHGANETVEFPGQTVKQIKGRVYYVYNDRIPVEESVVEAFEITEADTKLCSSEITQRKERKAACITSKV